MILLLLPILLKTSAASFFFFFFFSVHKNVKNILALNDTIFPFPDRWVFMCDLMGFKFSDLFLRNKLCMLEKS